MVAMPESTVTRMVEDYVTLIWKAYEWPGGEPTTTDLAARLSVTPSTVSANLKRLARDGFIEYEPYGRMELTEHGRRVAVEIVRRHRILETYLVRRLGLSWDQVHDEADRLEHAVSDVVLARMDEILDHPECDPHGDPIPDVEGNFVIEDTLPLLEAPRSQSLRVARVCDRSPEVLRFLSERGIRVGVYLQIAEVNSAASSAEIRLGGERMELSLQVADVVRVALDSASA